MSSGKSIEIIPYKEFTDSELTELVKSNTFAYLHYRSYFYPNALHVEDNYTKLETGIDVPLWNCVLEAKIPENTVEKIIQIRDSFLDKGYNGMGWLVYPFDQPVTLAETLLELGFKKAIKYYLMSSNIAELDDMPLSGFKIKPVRHETEMKTYFDIWKTVYAFMGPVSDDLYAIESLRGFHEDSPRQNFIGYLDGEPVSVSTLFFDGYTAGVYSVSTLPDVKDRFDIDVATGRDTLLMARKRGYKVGLAFTGEGGLKYYHGYGFKEKGDLNFSGYIYEKK